MHCSPRVQRMTRREIEDWPAHTTRSLEITSGCASRGPDALAAAATRSKYTPKSLGENKNDRLISTGWEPRCPPLRGISPWARRSGRGDRLICREGTGGMDRDGHGQRQETPLTAMETAGSDAFPGRKIKSAPPEIHFLRAPSRACAAVPALWLARPGSARRTTPPWSKKRT